MNFPQFWARGSSGDFMAWRWSFQSLAEAQALADDAAREVAALFRSGRFPPKHGGYYPNRPFREQILREIPNSSGETQAVITRNSYGCLVLNTARAMFVDIDFPEQRREGGFFQRLFGKTPAPVSTDPQSEAIARIATWTSGNPGWGWRVYRTRSGLRLLATHDLVAANSDAANAVFEALGADPLYKKLCAAQNCYRARLSPKPWRCGAHRKPERWPWLDVKRERRFQAWDEDYRKRAEAWATCEFIQHIGNPTIHPEVATILQLHDGPTRCDSKLPLA